jgi:predicted amidohydrolase
MERKVKVGIAQFASAHLQLQASLERMESIIQQAAKENVNLLVFGETWLSGYPAWIDHCPGVAQWDYEPLKVVFQRMHENGLSVPSPEFNQLCSWAKRFKIILSIGINETVAHGPGNGTIFNSLLLFNEQGELVNHRRKLMPTYTEKMLYGLGDGYDLEAASTSFGRIGGMICWEHWMPLTRQALHNSGEDIHIAAWPTVHEKHQIASRHYAFEGRCFVLAAGQIVQAKDFPKELDLPDHLIGKPEEYILKGGSCIIDPRGNYVIEPVFNEEKLIIAELDIASPVKEKMTLDVSGHYQRPDVFQFEVNRKRT